MNVRKAGKDDVAGVWIILQQAIAQRRKDGSRQWQDGYPNEQSIMDDIKNGCGYVLIKDSIVIAYAAVIFGKEPAYEIIEGKWLTAGNYAVVHRVAVSDTVKGTGIATKLFEMIENISIQNKVYSIRVDTNFDNIPMLKILNKLQYVYCGEVYFRGGARKAFEKVLTSA